MVSLPRSDRISRPSMRTGTRLSIWLADRLFSCLQRGRLTIDVPSGQRFHYEGAGAGPQAFVILHRWRALRRLLFNGDIGFAESYIDGDWSTPDLPSVVEFGAANMDALDAHMRGRLPARALNWLHHLVNANTRRGARRNISYHYDVGNDFYRLWLDRSMTYSSAIFEQPGQTLDEAQEAKIRRVIELTELTGSDRVLEIGCGWGALALRLAAQASQVTALTLSREQLAFATDLAKQSPVRDQLRFELKDYRDADGEFDRIVSIEMLEAVGERYWSTFFATLRDRLATSGKILLQAITIDEKRFDSYRATPDFIQRHVFPGGMLPTKSEIVRKAEAAGLTLVDLQSFGAGYAQTLDEWRRRFLVAWPKVESLGATPQFRRLWEYYFCYCAAGFRSGAIDVGFYVLKKT